MTLKPDYQQNVENIAQSLNVEIWDATKKALCDIRQQKREETMSTNEANREVRKQILDFWMHF